MIVPLNQPVALPPPSYYDAAPKCISGRTSYHGVCLAFHPYPQLIPAVFNLRGFAPPRRLTIASHWPWVDHPASGPGHATTTLVRIRFPYGYPTRLPSRHAADSQAHSSKVTPSPTQQGAQTDCRHMVSGTISLPSRGTFHHSLTVLIHYRSH